MSDRHAILPIRVARDPIADARAMLALSRQAERARQRGETAFASLVTLSLLALAAGDISAPAVVPL